MKECEFCYKIKEDATLVKNPWNKCHEIVLCDNCYENACDNARERQGNDYVDE